MGEQSTRPPLHYCFLTLGPWHNPSIVRLRELGKQLLDRGVRVSYLVDDEPYNRGDIGVDPRATVAFVPAGKTVRMAQRRRAALAGLAPDFVHVLNPSPKAVLTLWQGRRARLVTDWDEWPTRRKQGLLRDTINRLVQRWAFRHSSRVFVASVYMRDELHKAGVETVYLPYATYLKPQPDGASPYAEPTAVYLGTFYSTYDHDLLFEAALLLQRRGVKVPLTFVGSGPDIGKWEAFVRDNKLEHVTVAGFVANDLLWQYLRHAHVLLFPIRPAVLNLARCPSKTYAYAQARRPVIANPTGEVPSVLGDKAVYVEATAEAFADALEKLMGQPNLPDVDYGIERHNWAARAETLLAAVRTFPLPCTQWRGPG